VNETQIAGSGLGFGPWEEIFPPFSHPTLKTYNVRVKSNFIRDFQQYEQLWILSQKLGDS
jgi:hypothetical protein